MRRAQLPQLRLPGGRGRAGGPERRHLGVVAGGRVAARAHHGAEGRVQAAHRAAGEPARIHQALLQAARLLRALQRFYLVRGRMSVRMSAEEGRTEAVIVFVPRVPGFTIFILRVSFKV